jgi:ribosomal subunit interface protein
MSPDRRDGSADGGTLRVSVTARRPIADRLRAYAEERVERLARHTQLHDVTMIIEPDQHGSARCSVELVVHLHHVRLVSRGDGATVQEAVDLAVERADRQVLRRKDRVTHRKGHVGADGLAPRSGGKTQTAGT